MNFLALFKSWYFKWFIVAAILRILISGITYHPDLLAFSFAGKIFVDNFTFDIYSYLQNLEKGSLYLNYGNNFFTYPPLTYFVISAFHFILQPFYDQNFYRYLSLNFDTPYLFSGFFKHAILVKLPYLVFDLATAFVISQLFESENLKRKAFLLWVFNPVSIYASFMIGQFDIIPTFFVVLGLLFTIKNQNTKALLSFGIGGAFKIFPLLLVPFAVIILAKNLRDSIKLVLIGFLPFVLTTLPFLNSSAFRAAVLVNEQSQKLLYAKISVSGADHLYLFVVGYVLLITAAILTKLKGFDALWKYILIFFLFMFLITNFHPQWFLWVSPFLIIFICRYKQFSTPVIILLIIYILIIFSFDSSLYYGLLVPIYPVVKTWPNNILNSFSNILEPSLTRSLLRSLFAALSLIIIYITFSTFKVHKNEG